MKKKIVLALIAAMMLTLAACGGTGETGSLMLVHTMQHI